MVVVLILEADGKRLISIVSNQQLLKATITTHANSSSALQMFVSQYLKVDSLVLSANVHLAVELMSGADQQLTF